MKQVWKRVISAACVAALLAGMLLTGTVAMAATPEHTLWLVGDSTVCDYTGKDLTYYWPRNGYGMQIGQYLDGTYEVKNMAVSGASSKSFLAEGENGGKANYDAMMAGIKAGDALIIGFGHNDEKRETARYTNPNGDWQTEGSFAKNLWDNYVKPAQDKGAEVILCTPIVRRSDSATLSGDKIHVTPTKDGYEGGDYAAAIKKLGADKNVAVVDLTALTKAEYEKLGATETKALHAQAGKDVPDSTHLNVYGAEVVAQMLAKAIQENNTLALAAHVDPAKFTPDKTHVTIGPDYKEPTPGEKPTKDSVLGDPYDVYAVGSDTVLWTFKPTAFGALGSNPSKKNTDYWLFETDQDGNMHMKVGSNKGKVNADEDGIMMYWYAVPAGKEFKLTATAKLNALDTGNQVAFGLMARDDMHIDARDCCAKGSYTNYVAAGTLGDGSTNCFYRKDGVLTTTTKLSKPLEVGGEYALSITSNSDGYACQFGTEPAQSQGFDFSLQAVDKDYVYVGMFVARNVDVTFSDISLEITGGSEEPGPDQPAIEGAVAGGGLETLFAELPGAADADVTAVKYTGAMTGELTGEDLEYLVREVNGKVRVDIPGLKAGKYDLTMTVGGKDYEAKDIEVQAHDRSGFAHQTVAEDGTCTPYTEGVGAYNDDGTLKDDALVLYVTDANKETVTMTVGSTTVTGIGKILNSGQATQNKVSKVLLEASRADKPVVIRIVGTVTQPTGVSAWKDSDPGTDNGNNGGMVSISYAKNVTVEGIGPDATIDGWGLSFSGNNAEPDNGNYGKNFEVRNLSFRNVPEDCVEVTGKNNSDGTIKEPVAHAWVHNCEFYVPHIENPAAPDKAQGDGALDFKSGYYMTSSYNYFEGYHKTSLIGSDNKIQQYHVTWHHNHWKDCQQRMPLGRQADMHIYNNIYELDKANTSSGTWYGMSLRANVYVFSENNAFLKVKNPVIDEGSGGVCKSFGDVFTECTGTNNAKVVTDKTETVTSANKFANFDTSAGSYVAKGDYKLDTVDNAKKNIAAWGGVLKTADQLTTVPLKAVGGDEPDPEEPVKVTGVTLDRTSLTLKEGATATLVATVAPENADDKGVYWTSSDTAVVTVDQTGKVTAVKAGNATVTVKTDDGDKTATCAVKVNAKGSGNVANGNAGGSAKPVAKPTPVEDTYTDVVADSWYTSGVQFVVDRKLFIGIEDHVFAPELAMSRAMVMTVLARVDGKDPAAKEGEPWYAEAMAWAVEAGVSDGTMPESPVTLEQLAAMFYRYAQSKKLVNAAAADLSKVPDGDKVSGWAAEAITWALDAGILKGDENGNVNPQNNATRAQAAVIVQRFVELCEK